MKVWMTFSRSLGDRKDLILAMVRSRKKLALTTALTCLSNVKAESNIAPRFLTWGLTRVDRLPRLLVVSLMESGGPNNIRSVLFSFNCRKCCAIQHLMCSRQSKGLF